MNKHDKTIKLYKYTSLPVLLDILQEKKLVLLDPLTWEDRNDSYYFKKYKELASMKTVLALCFTMKSERFHHWKVFAGDISGVCILFHKDKLLRSFANDQHIMVDTVAYCTVKHLMGQRPSVDKLPFIKRAPYSDEEEFRIIYKDKGSEISAKEFHIDLSSIARIKLNPWMPLPLVKSVERTIRSINGCSGFNISQTTLLENDMWKNIANSLADKPDRPGNDRTSRIIPATVARAYCG
jgi:hypothetical protein